MPRSDRGDSPAGKNTDIINSRLYYAKLISRNSAFKLSPFVCWADKSCKPPPPSLFAHCTFFQCSGFIMASKCDCSSVNASRCSVFSCTGANAPSEFKCGLPKECPGDEFAFYLKSGIANILGPRICFEGKIIMSGVMNNIKRGMNIVLVNGGTGKVEKFESFDMYSGNVEDLLVFLKEIRKETLVLVASFDDASTILTDEVRNIFANLGSKEIETLGFRDAWVFAGAHTIQGNSIYEKILKNNETNNKYNGWPDLVDLGDCFPKNL
uniref:ILEI/PANDER domain-containing protein n=1 Tax=Denticeps clupeoides TaxID=299321 RepID=A0AAY4B946_9TELE